MHSIVRFTRVCLLAFVSLSACSKAELASPRAEPAKVRAAEPDPAIVRLPLAERLAREASARPARGVRAEALRERLDGQGVTLVRTRQVLAEPLGAKFCELSSSSQGLSVAVCEFEGREAAEAGLSRSRALFDKLMPGRTLLVNENALLTVAAGNPGERALAARLFASLPSSQRI